MEINLDISVMSVAEQRVFNSLLSQLDADLDGRIRTSLGVAPNSYSYRLIANASAYDLIAPDGSARAQLMRPLVLGGIKKMLADLKKNPSPAAFRSTTPRFSQVREPAFSANSDLGALLSALRAPGPGIFEIRFGDGASVKVDRLAQNFRCKGFNRSDLLKKLYNDTATWGQISQESNLKSEETQASLSPFLYFLGVVSAKDAFMMGNHQDQEFQIRQVVGFGRAAGHDRIASAFSEFAGVSDAALRLAVAPKEVLGCLNGYAALGFVRARAKDPNAQKPTGLLSMIKSKLGG
jgi:hypothetical protein